MKVGQLLPTGNKLSKLFWIDLERRIQFWPKLSMALQCHKIKLTWRFFGSNYLPFWEIKAINSETWTLFAHWKQIDKFFCVYLESRVQFWLKVCMALQCHKIKLLWRFFGSGSLLFRQKKTIKYEILTLFGLLETNWPISFLLIWNAGFSFGWKFAWPFSATK